MAKDKTKKSKLFDFKFSEMKINERLRKSFNVVILMASLGSIVGIICMLLVTAQFKHAMNNYALPQGDIALFMNEYAECRSNMRGIIGYQDRDLVNELVKKHEVRKETTYQRLAAIEKTMVTDEGRDSFNKIEKALEAYFKKEAEVIALGNTEDRELSIQAQELAIRDITPLYSALDEATLELMEINKQKEAEMEKFSEAVELGSMILMVVLVISAATGAKVLASRVGRSIALPLEELQERFESFAKGDIRTPFPSSTVDDEIADLMNASKEMADRLKVIISDVERLCTEMSDGNFDIESDCPDEYRGDLRSLYEALKSMNHSVNDALKDVEDVADQVNIGAVNLAEAAQSLAEGATDQAASVQEMLATMNTLSDGLRETVNNTDEAYRQAMRCAQDAQRSGEEMKNMVNSMDRISETSKKIEVIISEIENIASQTNLLSLNASIEAARAGDAGRGFAVVADQIRTLAEQSAQAAIDTRSLVENTLHEIGEGSKVAYRTSEVLEGVVGEIQKIAESAKDISDNTNEQAKAMAQADAGINRISEVVQSNSAAAEESSATSEELSAQAMTMHDLVGRFTLRK